MYKKYFTDTHIYNNFPILFTWFLFNAYVHAVLTCFWWKYLYSRLSTCILAHLSVWGNVFLRRVLLNPFYRTNRSNSDVFEIFLLFSYSVSSIQCILRICFVADIEIVCSFCSAHLVDNRIFLDGFLCKNRVRHWSSCSVGTNNICTFPLVCLADGACIQKSKSNILFPSQPWQCG